MLQCRSGWLSCSILCWCVVSFFLHIHLYHLHFSNACTGKHFNYQNGADLDFHDKRLTNYRWMFIFANLRWNWGVVSFFCFILIEAKALGLLMLGFGKMEVSRVRGKKTRTSTCKVHREFVQHLQRGETSQHKARQHDVLFAVEETWSN